MQELHNEIEDLFNTLAAKVEILKSSTEIFSMSVELKEKFEFVLYEFSSQFMVGHRKSISLTSKDLTTNESKADIRNMISTICFGMTTTKLKNDFNLFCDSVEIDNLNNSISILKEIDSEGFDTLYSFVIPGVGPGELLMYYLVDDVVLGGGSSAGVDVISSTGNFEVKAVAQRLKNKIFGECLVDFKLGGGVPLDEIITSLKQLSGISTTEISMETINPFRNDGAFIEIENEYKRLTAEYFSNHNVVFFNHSKNMKLRGSLIRIGAVKEENVFIERVTSGTVKPLLKF